MHLHRDKRSAKGGPDGGNGVGRGGHVILKGNRILDFDSLEILSVTCMPKMERAGVEICVPELTDKMSL